MGTFFNGVGNYVYHNFGVTNDSINLFFLQVKWGDASASGGLDISFGLGNALPFIQAGVGKYGVSLQAGIPGVLYAGVGFDFTKQGFGLHGYAATLVGAVYVDLDRYGIGASVDTLIGGSSIQVDWASAVGLVLGGPAGMLAATVLERLCGYKGGSYVDAHLFGFDAYVGTDAVYATSWAGGFGFDFTTWREFDIPNHGKGAQDFFGQYAGPDYQGGQMEGSPGDPSGDPDLYNWRQPRDPVDRAMMMHDYSYYKTEQSQHFRDQNLHDALEQNLWNYNPYDMGKAWLALPFF